MSEALPDIEDGEIRWSVVKALKLCEENDVVTSFKNDQYFVKSQSRPNAAPHVITMMQTGMIRCDTTCEKYQKEGFCSHCLCVALEYNEIQRYTVALSHCQEKSWLTLHHVTFKRIELVANELLAKKVYLLQVLKSLQIHLKSQVFRNKQMIMESV